MSIEKSDVVDVMISEHFLFLFLFERCMRLIPKVPPERRPALIEIAEQCLRLGEQCIDQEMQPPKPNAPTIHRFQ